LKKIAGRWRYVLQKSDIMFLIINDSRMRALAVVYGRIGPTELASDCGNTAQQLSQ
jgi:hypothetical protein